jgi:hypothetical protein
MVYAMDEEKLLRVWTVTRLIGAIREVRSPTVQSEILIEAQTLLTSLVPELNSLPRIKPAL